MSSSVDVDVLVAGGGVAGVAAALAAARQGARTLLVERGGAAGGAFTQGLAMTPVGFEPFKHWLDETDPDTWKVQGIAREVHDRMAAAGAVRKPTWDPEAYKRIADELLDAAGVRVWLHAVVVDAAVGAGRLGAVTVYGAGARHVIRPAVAIDATGDGELFALAGCAHEAGRADDGQVQPLVLTTAFGGVRLPYRAGMSYREMIGVSQEVVIPRVNEAVAAGRLPPVFPGICFPRVTSGRVVTDAIWCRMINVWARPGSIEELSEAEREARRMLVKLERFFRTEVPGFEDAWLSHVGARAWPREGRRLRGVDRVVEEDVRTDRPREDGIAKGCGHMETHTATPGVVAEERGFQGPRSRVLDDVCYDIPYGALVPAELDGLLVAGRCIASDRAAQSSLRMQATCMATGEAAGTAAALAVAGRRAPRELSVERLRERLRAGGAIV